MTLTAFADMICAVFTGIVFVRNVAERSTLKSSRLLSITLLLTVVALLDDAMAYTFIGTAYPVMFRFIINLMSFLITVVLSASFSFYAQALFTEKGRPCRPAFIAVRILQIVWFAATLYAYLSGHLITYDANGVESVDYAVPVYLTVLQFAVLLIMPVLTLINSRYIGARQTVLMVGFSFIPVISTYLYTILGIDFAYPLCSVALVLIAVFAQKAQMESLQYEYDEQRARDEEYRILAENYSRIFALEDNFESLYDVELESGRYVSYVKGEFYQKTVIDKLVEPGDYFEDLRANIEAAIWPEDREGLYARLTRDGIRAGLAGNEHFDYYYRINGEDGPIWFKMRLVYKNSEKTNVIIGVFNAAEEMAARIAAEEQLKAKELELAHSEFRASALAYLTENEGDITSFLNFFAGRLRELVGCDQVIYRDAEGKMFVNNAPQLGDGFSVPAEVCRSCPHYDINSPVYADGVTEMEDARAGYKGIPAHESCPVKSALTRVVYLDGKTEGYLTVHYILERHTFSDYERQTLEEFTQLLSLLITHYAARTENAYLAHELELKRQIETQNELLRAAREEAENANRSKTDFLFNMSHDIRTPMNAIRGFTAMAKKNADNGDAVRDYLDKIDISGRQLLTLINQVLEMARIESGKMVFDEKPFNVNAEFDSMTTVFSEQAGTYGLEFTAVRNEIEHPYVLADEARMSSVTLNIVGNAMKYTPAGGRVEYEIREIPARRPGYASFVYTVSDTGIGMSKEYLEKLYEPFTRENSSTVSRIQGTGLGMSIVKSVIDLMGGNIEVQSEPGKGTRFDITVDFRIDPHPAAYDDDDGEEVSGVSFDGRRVLLADDNEMNREIATDILEDAGLIVEEADDGDTAAAMVQAAYERGEYGYYDFILMDIQMPRMNGYDATKAIRALPAPEGVYIPIIAMTANAFDEDRRNALAAGMDAHLAKPVDVQKMFETIAVFLK